MYSCGRECLLKTENGAAHPLGLGRRGNEAGGGWGGDNQDWGGGVFEATFRVEMVVPVSRSSGASVGEPWGRLVTGKDESFLEFFAIQSGIKGSMRKRKNM